MSSAGGKGSARRPSQISEEELQAKWDLIYKKDKQLDTLSENPKEESNEQRSQPD